MSTPDLKFSSCKHWLEMIPEPRPSGLPWVGGIVVTAMVGAYAWSFGVAKADNPVGTSATPEFEVPEPADPELSITHAASIDSEPDDSEADASEQAPLEPEAPKVPARRARPKRVPAPLTAAEARRARRAARKLREATRADRVLSAPTIFAKVLELEGTPWQEASAACRDLEIDGVTGWRLPSRGEMPELRRKVPSAVFWTKSRSYRDPDGVWVYDTGRRRRAVWLEQEPTGATVCVQPRPR